MRICIPTENNNGINSIVYGHFGSAPYFIIYDTETNKINVINNMDTNHKHGECNPISSLADEAVDIMVTGGIGLRALQILNQNRIKAFKQGKETTVSQVIKNLENNKLTEIKSDNACSQHGCH